MAEVYLDKVPLARRYTVPIVAAGQQCSEEKRGHPAVLSDADRAVQLLRSQAKMVDESSL